MEKRFFKVLRILRIGLLLLGCLTILDASNNLTSNEIRATLHCNGKEMTNSFFGAKSGDEVANTITQTLYIDKCISENEFLTLLEKNLPNYALFKKDYSESQKTDLFDKIKQNRYEFFGDDAWNILADNLVTSGIITIDYERQTIEWGDIGFALIKFISLIILIPFILEKIVWKYIRDGKIWNKKN